MKLIYTLAATLFATLSSPVWADSAWDVPSQSVSEPVVQQSATQNQTIAFTQASNGAMQFDTSGMTINSAQAYEALMLQQAQQQNHSNAPTYLHNVAQLTGNLRNPNLPVTQTGLMTPGGLQATSLDSFVVNAGGQAELIYGDEGTSDIPPYFGFDSSHTINSGIHGNLTTGHASGLPGAWTSY